MPSTDLHGRIRSLLVSLHRALRDIFPNMSESGGNVKEGHETNAERVSQTRRFYSETDARDE